MNPHEPGPPLLLTMIMNAIVMPRTTSSERSRLTGVGTTAGLTAAVCFSVRLGFIRSPRNCSNLSYPEEPGCAKCRYAEHELKARNSKARIPDPGFAMGV